MQILKKFLFAFSIAAVAAPFCVRADEDTDVQAAARAAMQQKMREMSGQSATAPQQPVAPPVQPQIKEAPVRQPVPEVAPVTRPTTAPRPVFPEPGARPTPRRSAQPAPARPAMTEPAPARPAFTPAPQPAPVAVPSTQPIHPSDEMVSPAPSSDSDIERARAAMRAKMAELEAQKHGSAPAQTQAAPSQPAYQPMPGTASSQPAPAKPAKQPEAPKAKPQKEVKPSKAPETVTFTPLEAPPTNLGSSKEQRLQALLNDYRADKITAEEYHDQRAKILNEK